MIEKLINRGFVFAFSGHSDAASGLSDGNEGRHEGRSMKRPQRRSVRSRSRHEKSSKAKLNVLEVRSSLLKFATGFIVFIIYVHALTCIVYVFDLLCCVFFRYLIKVTEWLNVSLKPTTGRW